MPESYITEYAVHVQEFGEGVRFKQAIRTCVTIPLQVSDGHAYHGLQEGGHFNKAGSLTGSEACYESGNPRQHCLRPDLVREEFLSPQLPSHTKVLTKGESNRILGDFVSVKQTAPYLASDKLEQREKALHEAMGTVETVQFGVADDSRDMRGLVGRNGLDWRGLEFLLTRPANASAAGLKGTYHCGLLSE